MKEIDLDILVLDEGNSKMYSLTKAFLTKYDEISKVKTNTGNLISFYDCSSLYGKDYRPVIKGVVNSKLQEKYEKEKEYKKFKIPLWWYELHGAEVVIKAKSKEELEKVLKNKFNQLRMIGIESGHETFGDFGDSGVDEIKEIKEESITAIKENKIKEFEEHEYAVAVIDDNENINSVYL